MEGWVKEGLEGETKRENHDSEHMPHVHVRELIQQRTVTTVDERVGACYQSLRTSSVKEIWQKNVLATLQLLSCQNISSPEFTLLYLC